MTAALEKGPLAGVRVLDFATALAGPWAAGILADQGADVIKIEAPGGDFSRDSGTAHNGVGSMWHLANRGKRSIELDLRTDEGRGVAHQLVRSADIVVQNFRVGVAERLGVGWDDLRAVNPDLIFVAVTGFGPDGPYARRAAFDSVIQACSGMSMVHADADGTPQLLDQTIADKVAAMSAAQAAVAALFARERGAGGQRVDVPMLDTSIAFAWVDMAGAETLLDAGADEIRPVAGVRRFFRFADGWGMVSITRPSDLLGAAAAFGVDAGSYGDDFDALRDAVRAAAGDLTTAEATDRLEAVGVPFGICNEFAGLHLDPQVTEVGLFVETEHPVAGRIREPRSPIRFSATPTSRPGLSPSLGEHAAELRAELADS